MANALYDNYKNLILGAGTHAFPDLNTNDIRCLLIDSATYVVNLATHQDHADVTAGGIISTAALASETVGVIAAGVFDAADLTFSAVTGASVEAYVIYDFQSAVSATSPLIAYFDTASAGLPVTPNGGDITIAFNASGIIAI